MHTATGQMAAAADTAGTLASGEGTGLAAFLRPGEFLTLHSSLVLEEPALRVLAALFVLLAGAALASFAITAAQRAVRKERFVSGRSHCDVCQTQLRTRHLVPVLSWLFLRGRCAFCQAPIPFFLPVFEACTAIWLLGIYLKQGFSPVLAGSALLLTPLCLLAVSDLERGTLPDRVLLPLTAAVFCSKWLLGAELVSMLGWAGACVLALSALRWLWQRRRGCLALGMGDIKLSVLLAVLAEEHVPLVIATASVLAGLAACIHLHRDRGKAAATEAPVAEPEPGKPAAGLPDSAAASLAVRTLSRTTAERKDTTPVTAKDNRQTAGRTAKAQAGLQTAEAEAADREADVRPWLYRDAQGAPALAFGPWLLVALAPFALLA